MKKTAVFTILTLFLLLTISASTQAAEVAGKSLSIVLDQTDPAAPAIISVTAENNNPERYKIKQIDHYFTVKLEDVAGTLLFQGEVKRYKLDTVNNGGTTAFIEIPENPVAMHLPFFDEARKVRIFDEAGTQLLEIDLGQFGIGTTPTAAPRFADCNACGYCKANAKQPGDLKQCMQCLYPDFVDNPDGTLAVDPIKNQPVQPKAGRQFTQLGCIDVGEAGFRDPSAAGGVLNVILNRLLFPITGALSVLALIYGAFLVMTSQDDAERIARGKKWIYGAIIGVVFSFGTILLIRIIGGDILKIPGLNI